MSDETKPPPGNTPPPWRMHDMETATIVAGKPGGEVANCLNGFGDQVANAVFIVEAVNTYASDRARIKELTEALALVQKGIRSGHIEDQTIVFRASKGAKKLPMRPLSEIIDAALASGSTDDR